MRPADDFLAWAERINAKLWRYAYHTRNDSALADDAVQHAMEQAWLQWQTPEWEQVHFARFRSYVFQTARNHIFKDWRDWRSRRGSLPNDLPDRRGGIPPARREAVWTLVQHLPEHLREIIRWFFFDGESYAKIGRRLDPSLSLTPAQSKYGKRKVEEAIERLIEISDSLGFDPGLWT